MGSLALLASACGTTKRDANEPSGSFPVQITQASFPSSQAIARGSELVIALRNSGTRTMPDVAVTLSSFYYRSDHPGLADRNRPVWIVDQGPGAIANPPVETESVDPAGGGQTAFPNTWALGPLPPGRTRRFVWHVTPVKAGVHTVSFTVAAAVNGRARAKAADGGPPVGHFTVHIASEPPARHVNPATGQLAAGPLHAAH